MKKVILICIFFIIFLISCDKNKPATSKINDAKIIFSLGDVKVKAETDWEIPKENMKLTEKNEIKTGKGAQCNILIGQESYIAMKENSHVIIATLIKDVTGFEDNTLELKLGKSVINPKKLLKGDSFRIKTPTAIAAVRGTQFVIETQPEGEMKIAVVEGKVELKRRVPVLENVDKDVINKSNTLIKLQNKIEGETVIIDKNHSASLNNIKIQKENKVIDEAITKHVNELKNRDIKETDKKSAKGDLDQQNIQIEKSIEKDLSDLSIMKKRSDEKEIIVAEKIKAEDQKDVKELSEFINNEKDKNKLDQKEEKKAEFEIKSPVKDSSIYINSKLIGSEDIKLYPLPGARLNILVSAKGYEDYKTVIDFKGDENKIINVELIKNPLLTVILPVKNGKIYFNSNYTGFGSASYSPKAGSKVLIEIEAQGFKKYSTEIVLNSGDVKTMNIPLEKIKDFDRVKWSEKLGNQISISPIYYKDRLIVTTTEGCLIVVNRDGNRLWKVDIKKGIESTPVVHNDNIYMVSTSGDFYSIKFQDGSINWKKKIYGALLFGAKPVVVDSSIFLATSYGRIYSFDIGGNEIWIKDIKNGVYTSVEYKDGMLYLGAEDHKLYALSSKNGDILWTFKVDSRMVSSSPIVHNKTLFIGCYSGTIYAIDIERGKEKWKFITGDSVFSTPTVDNERVYFGSNDGYLYSLSTVDGSLLWKYNTGSKLLTKPEIKNMLVYATSGKQIFVLNANTGKLQWNHMFSNPIKTSAIIVENDIFIGLENGEVASVRDSLKDIFR